MVAKRSFWFTVNLENPLSLNDLSNLINCDDYLEFWEYGTFMVVRTRILHTCEQIHNYLDVVLDDSPVDVCLADDLIIILDRLEVLFNSIQD